MDVSALRVRSTYFQFVARSSVINPKFKLDELCIYTDVFFIVIELDHVHLHPGMCISSA